MASGTAGDIKFFSVAGKFSGGSFFCGKSGGAGGTGVDLCGPDRGFACGRGGSFSGYGADVRHEQGGGVRRSSGNFPDADIRSAFDLVCLSAAGGDGDIFSRADAASALSGGALQ